MTREDAMVKIRVKIEDEFELSTICRQLKMRAPDGKMREGDRRELSAAGQQTRATGGGKRMSKDFFPPRLKPGCTGAV
ncbi:MAG: hypothetical protein WA117_21900 [Verrucomicrobiia bacterium]